MTELVLTTTHLDVLYGGAAKVNLSTTRVEALHAGHLKVKLSTTRLEVLYSNAPPPPPPPPIPLTARYAPIPCLPPPRSRFRKFWATQINACPSETSVTNCDPSSPTQCLSPGLVLQPIYDAAFQELTSDGSSYDPSLGQQIDTGGSYSSVPQQIIGATISTENWVAGLVLNILGTNAQQSASICGNRPGQKGGYWLDDISGAKSGSSIRYIPTLGYSINQQVQFVQQQAAADLNKLIKYGVANTVSVIAKYAGNMTIELIITVIGVDDKTTVVNSTMTKITNAWVWN